MAKFRRDLAIGQAAEEYFITLASNKGLNTSKSKTGSKEYDVEVNGVKFEIKYDLYSAKSGNIAIEFYNSKLGKPSGVMATEANYWIYFLGDLSRGYFISIQNLKELLEIKPLRIIEKGGDDNASLMLYKIDDVIEKFTALEHVWNIIPM
jgi:hypothetical protein